MGLFDLVQYGKELSTAHGTPVPAASILLCDPIKPPDDGANDYPGYSLNSRAKAAGSNRYEQKIDDFTISIPKGYFQILPMLGSILLKGGITPTAHTGGIGFFDWEHTPGLTPISNAPDSITLEVGDDQAAYQIPYVMGKELTIAGSCVDGGPVSLSMKCFGQKIAANPFTATLSYPVIEPMIANLAKLYIDPTWATKGTTLKAGMLCDFSLVILAGNAQRNHGNSLYPNSHVEGRIEASLALTLEGADVDAYYDASRPTPPATNPQYAFALEIPGTIYHGLKVCLWGDFEYIHPMESTKDDINQYKVLVHGVLDLISSDMLSWLATTNQDEM